jgi:DNA polymerase III delta prime subunit
VLDATEINTKLLREELRKVFQKPFGAQKLFLINNAQALSDILQNTLLKVVEEPPGYAVIVLQAPSAEGFLPTLRSRLHLKLGKNASGNVEESILDTEVLAKKALATIKDREALLQLLEKEKKIIIKKITKDSDAPKVILLEKLTSYLRANGNIKLAIDSLLLHWFEESVME